VDMWTARFTGRGSGYAGRRGFWHDLSIAVVDGCVGARKNRVPFGGDDPRILAK